MRCHVLSLRDPCGSLGYAITIALVLLSAQVALATDGSDHVQGQPQSDIKAFKRDVLGTPAKVFIYGADAPLAEDGALATFRALSTAWYGLDAARPDSDIARLNNAAGGGPVAVAPETLEAMRRGKAISELSDGAFALSFAALSSLWHFANTGSKAPKVPSVAVALERTDLIDDSQVEIDESAGTARLARVGMVIGLAGIAKGYALERAATAIKSRGIENALIVFGGDLISMGAKGRRRWLVGIQDPRGDGYFATIAATDVTIATSGDYKRFFEVGQTRYHHILDPRSGFPAVGCRSVTVVAKDPVVADGISTAAFVLGPERGMQLIESNPGLEAVIVTDNNQVLVSTGLSKRARVLRQPTP